MASVHASEATQAAMKATAVLHPATKHVVFAVCCILAQASATLTRFVFLWNGPWPQTTRTTHPCQTRRLNLHAAISGICTPNFELAALHRSAPRVRRWTTRSLVKNSQPSLYHIVPFCCHTCPLPRVWCLPVVSRVRCLRSVCPAHDFPIKDVFWGQGKSDGIKWCPHKMISAHVLACTSGNRPCS